MSSSEIIKFRNYQKLAIEEIIELFHTKDFLLSVMSMGGGKSLIISEIAKYYSNLGKNVVILVNISELVPQLIEHLNLFNLQYKVIKSGYDLENDIISSKVNIYLIMEQSFHEAKRLSLKLKSYLLIKDEFHYGYGLKRYNDIVEALSPKKILGLSGTPFDEKGFLLNNVKLDDLILHGTAEELTNLGYLVKLKYFSVKWSENIDYSSVKISKNDYSNSDLDTILNTIEHTNLIVSSMNEMNSKNKKTLVYCNSISHANSVYEALKKDGYKVGVVHSKIKSSQNEDTISRFGKNFGEKDSIDCLVSISKLTTGYNQPKASLLVLCRPTKILRLYLQILFRVARPFNGNEIMPKKEFGEILDLAQCVKMHGFGIAPRKFIEKSGNALPKKETNKSSIPVIKDIVSDTPTEITLDQVNLKMKELKMKELDVKQNSLTNLINIYNNSMDFNTIVSIIYELNYRANKVSYTDSDVKEKTNFLISEYEELKKKRIPRLIQNYKSQLRSYVKNKKPLNEFSYQFI